MSRNTYPPLISGSSWDFIGQRQLLGDAVLDSLLIQQTANDLFFHPTLGLTGFGYDGNYYEKGKVVPGKLASWFTEGPSHTRGPLSSFPHRALVLLTDASVAILDVDSDLTMWMIFARSDYGAFTDNFEQKVQGYLPSKLSYTSGGLLINMVPDVGCEWSANVCVVIDFQNDRAYVDCQTPSGARKPDPTKGFLRNEFEWLGRMMNPVRGDYGVISRVPVDLTGFDAHGGWGVHGYTPQPAPTPVMDYSIYTPEYVGPVKGYLSNFLVKDCELYEVVMYSFDDTKKWVEISRGPVGQDGRWELTGAKGTKDVMVFNKNSGWSLGSSSTEPWDANYAVLHVFQDPVSGPVPKKLTPAYASGKWDLDFMTGEPLPPEKGQWDVQLVRTYDSQIMASNTRGGGLIRSWAVPREDSRFDKLKNLCHISDQAGAILSAASLADQDPDLFLRLVYAALRVQNADGSWSEAYDLIAGEPLNGGHKNLYPTAMMCYAFLVSLKAYPGISTELKGQMVEATHKGLEWCRTKKSPQGPTKGFFLEGHGTYDATGLYLDIDLNYALTESQALLCAVFKSAAEQIPLRGQVNQNYHVDLGDLLALSEAVLWTPVNGRYAQGVGDAGPDLKDTGWSRVWSLLFPVFRDDKERFFKLFRSMSDYRVTTPDGDEGYTPFNPSMGYKQERVVWPVLGLILALMSTKNPETVGDWSQLCLRATTWRDFDGGWLGGMLYHSWDSMSTWANTSAVTWGVMAQNTELKRLLFS